MSLRSTADKLKTVREKNTYYFKNELFEEEMQSHIDKLIFLAKYLKEDLIEHGCTKDVLNRFLTKENALKALLGVTSVSFEMLQRIVTIIRRRDFKEFTTVFYKDKWNSNNLKTEWGAKKIEKMTMDNEYFRKAMVNIFFETNKTILGEILTKYDLSKMDSSVINNVTTLSDQTIDILMRYKEKGSYAARKGNNPEIVLQTILDDAKITYDSGCDLPLLAENEKILKRTMDYMIPSKENPILIIESSYVTTTSSGCGDKAKTENGVNPLNKKYYPNAIFIGFIDGVGWYTRVKDAERMCEGFDDVFTYHKDELNRFKNLLKELFPENFAND
tara:strand:- start:959 stop:1951 length:993 start_codon:yes stop_codon:yes gene_type:complete